MTRAIKRLFGVSVIAALAALVLAAPRAGAAETPVGTWITGDGEHMFRVAGCGKSLCVYLARVPVNVADSRNPDPAKRHRRIAGMMLVSDGAASGPARWEGHVYNWEDGKTYFGYVEPIDALSMKATGCLIGRAMCLSTRLYRLR